MSLVAKWAVLTRSSGQASLLLLLFLVVFQFLRLQAHRQRQTQLVLWRLRQSRAARQWRGVVQRLQNFGSALASVTWHGGSAKGRAWSLPRGEHWKLVQQRWPTDKFRRYYRVEKTRFQALCADLADPQWRLYRVNSAGRGLSIEQVVGACLRRLGSGADLFSVAEDHGMSEAALHERMRLFCRAVRGLYESDRIKLPTDEDELRGIMRGFSLPAGFVYCCGAIDGTHVPVRPPAEKAAQYLNHKGWSSINTLLLVDHKRRIRGVHTGWPGGAHDAKLFRQSTFGRMLLDGSWPPSGMGGRVEGVYVQPYCVADAAFPDCNGRVVKPFPGGMLQDGNRFRSNVNYKQSATRMAVEHANGMLKRRWRILLHPTEVRDMGDVVDIIMCCCVLHNICVDDRGDAAVEVFGDEEEGDAALMGTDVTPIPANEQSIAAADDMYAVLNVMGVATDCMTDGRAII